MLYNSIAQCCEKTAPILFRTIFDSCNLEKTRGIVGGFFDGPRAWQWVLVWLSGGGRRTKADKDYYRLAERLQRENMLADGCLEAVGSHPVTTAPPTAKPRLVGAGKRAFRPGIATHTCRASAGGEESARRHRE